MAKRAPQTTAAPLIPEKPTLAQLREIAAGCQACELYKTATQTVFGEGEPTAKAIFVGEQAGDQEDKKGKPFVGPAGRLLDRALAEAGIDRSLVYVTNVVKHFKWEAGGGRRLHKKPGVREIAACSPWLDAEIKVLQPNVIVCLGSTAAMTILGKDFRVTKSRGIFVPSPLAAHVLATVHPSSIVRERDTERRNEEMGRFVADLIKVAEVLP